MLLPHLSRQERMEITVNKSGELKKKKLFLCKHDCYPVGKTPGKPFADRIPNSYEIRGGIHYILISGFEGDIGGCHFSTPFKAQWWLYAPSAATLRNTTFCRTMSPNTPQRPRRRTSHTPRSTSRILDMCFCFIRFSVVHVITSSPALIMGHSLCFPWGTNCICTQVDERQLRDFSSSYTFGQEGKEKYVHSKTSV